MIGLVLRRWVASVRAGYAGLAGNPVVAVEDSNQLTVFGRHTEFNRLFVEQAFEYRLSRLSRYKNGGLPRSPLTPGSPLGCAHYHVVSHNIW